MNYCAIVRAMYRLAIAALAVSAAPGCTSIECTGEGANVACTGDDRPATIEYVTTTILKPACANAQCHSATTAAAGYQLDTVAHVRESGLVTPGDDTGSFLFNVLIREQPEGARMPYDQPLPLGDIALIRRWILEGADGLEP